MDLLIRVQNLLKLHKIYLNNRFFLRLYILFLSLFLGGLIHAEINIDFLQSDIMQQIENRTVSYRQVPVEDVVVTLSQPIRFRDIPETATYYNLDIPESARLGGRHIWQLHFYDDQDTQLRTLYVFADVDIMGEVIRAKRTIQPKAIIQADDLMIKRESILSMLANRYDTIEDVVGKQAVVYISRNSPITTLVAKEKPLIEYGQRIDVKIIRNGIQIKVKARALENGYLGKTIRAQTLLKNDKIIQGTVIDNETIKVNSISY